MAELFQESQVFNLENENELRILVGEQPTTIQLTSGLAEIFGTQMIVNDEYRLPSHSSIAIFSWQGCSIKITGKPVSAHVVSDTLMILNVILHASLEELRIKAKAENSKGPVVLVVGPKDTGKTSLCSILLNYATRMGHRPVYLDLDVGQNSITIPGSVGLVDVKKPASIVRGFSDRPAMLYHFGYNSPGHNLALYYLLLRQLQAVVQSHFQHASENVRSSGMVINTCGWVIEDGYNTIVFAAKAFQIDHLCVLDDEELHSKLSNDMPPNVKVHYIPKMTGVAQRSPSVRFKMRNLSIFNYIYRNQEKVTPKAFVVLYSRINVIKLSFQRPLNGPDIEIGTRDLIVATQVPLTQELTNKVLGMSLGQTIDDKMLMRVIGFALVKHVNVDKGEIKIVTTQPDPQLTKFFLVGNVKLI
ncbi:hypothetical protein JTE90_005879 [Oedothorax gibbosus]|uniref:Protein CLP1 homolog n=1 Tax=Oedothorax gibbosus TaxID=931172 RepID=A0AAV6UPY7_9ARAC|nr:hypothetical protein JTE90_005879 [Oedothorax gibbosus]